MLKERGITLRQALEIQLLRSAKVVSGSNGLDNVITGVNIMEVPDIVNWVKSGELLLTTAYSLRDDKEGLVKLVEQLHQKGLAGIAIKTKRYIEHVPSEVVAISNKLGFPIIELPVDMAFSDVTNVILREIFDKQAGILYRLDEIHQKLMSVVLSGGGLKDICSMLNGIVENPVLVKDYVFGRHVKAAVGDKESNAAKSMLKSIESSKNIFADVLSGIKEPYIKISEKSVEDSQKLIQRLVFPIAAGQKIYGEIQILGLSREINQVDVRAVQYTCAIIALEIIKQISVFEVESRHRNEFMEELLSIDPSLHMAAIERAEAFGLTEDYSYMLLSISMERGGRLSEDASQSKGSLLKRKLISALENEAEGKSKVLVASRGDNITVLLGFNNSDCAESVKERLNKLAEKAHEIINSTEGEVSCFIGISRPCRQLSELHKKNEEAKKALSFSRIFKNRKTMHYDDLGIFRLLCIEHQESEIKKFCHETVLPLLEYDKNKDGELIKTLRTYFECGGNLKQVCKQMYIHYNTILYRIQKIQQITGVDLSDSNARLNLEISLKIMSMLGYTIGK